MKLFRNNRYVSVKAVGKHVAPGKLLFTFKDATSTRFQFYFICDTKQNDNDSNLKVHGTTVQDAPYWILDTDYENYAVVWSCSENAGMKAGKCKKKKVKCQLP